MNIKRIKSNTFGVGAKMAEEYIDYMYEMWESKKDELDLRAEGIAMNIFLTCAQNLYDYQFATRKELHDLLDEMLNGIDELNKEEQ